MTLKNYNKLRIFGNSLNMSALLFDFDFVEIKIKCVYFTETNNLLLSLLFENIACIVAFSNDGVFDAKLPPEFYYSIRDRIIEKTKKDNIVQLWEELDKRIFEMDVVDFKIPITNELIRLISELKTTDKGYDKDGNKPFFKTWKRNNSQNVRSTNLYKTQRYFGKEIMKLCNDCNISSVWCDTVCDDSLSFVHVENARNKIISL